MKPELRTLIELQALDIKIVDFRDRLAELPRRLEAYRQQAEAQAAIQTARENEHKLTQKDIALGESELKGIEEKVKQHQTKLFQVRDNKEYAALLNEIEALKAKRGEIEERILLWFDQLESLSKVIQEEKGRTAEKKARLTEEEQHCAAEMSSLDDRAKELEGERAGLAQALGAGLLARYEELRRHKDNLAVVPVRSESCSGCYMSITPQTLVEIRKELEFIACDNCMRILYWDPNQS